MAGYHDDGRQRKTRKEEEEEMLPKVLDAEEEEKAHFAPVVAAAPVLLNSMPKGEDRGPSKRVPIEGDMPIQPPMEPVSPSPLSPTENYLTQKYNIDPDALVERRKLQDRVANSGSSIGAGLAAFGAGLQGHDAGEAYRSNIRGSKEGAKQSLKDYDENQKLMKDAEKRNGKSEASIAKAALANKLSGTSHFTGMSEEQIDRLLPTVEKVYQADLANKARQASLSEGALNRAATERYHNALIELGKQKADSKSEQVAKNLTEGEKAVDRNFAKQYNEWTEGGEPAFNKNVDLLENAKTRLQKAAKNNTFSPSGNIVGRLPDIFKPEENKTIRDDVRKAAQAALKQTLGAQFTEKEGERIMSGAYDESLSPEANIKKIDSAIQELRGHAHNINSKASHYENNRTLKGYKLHPGAEQSMGASPQMAPKAKPSSEQLGKMSLEELEKYNNSLGG